MKLDSSRVNSYPSTKRASVNKLLTENSVTRVINRLIDSDSYVITNGLSGIDFSKDIPVAEWNNSAADFEFVIHGYYFSISKGDSASGLSYLLSKAGFHPSDDREHVLFARIFIDKIDPDYPELYGQTDKDGEYQGISFYIDEAPVLYPDGSNESVDYEFYDAPLVRYIANDAGTAFESVVPLTSLHRFGSQAIANIDGGEIVI